MYIAHVNCGLFVAHPLGRPVPPREFDLLGHLDPHERLDGGEFHGQGNQRAGVGIFLDLWQKKRSRVGAGGSSGRAPREKTRKQMNPPHLSEQKMKVCHPPATIDAQDQQMSSSPTKPTPDAR